MPNQIVMALYVGTNYRRLEQLSAITHSLQRCHSFEAFFLLKDSSVLCLKCPFSLKSTFWWMLLSELPQGTVNDYILVGAGSHGEHLLIDCPIRFLWIMASCLPSINYQTYCLSCQRCQKPSDSDITFIF